MATPPPVDAEFPGDMSVLDWEGVLLARYQCRCPISSPPRRSRMHNLKIATIRRFKVKNAEHEYVVAKVYDSNLGRNRYLRIGDLPPNRCYCCHNQDDTIPTSGLHLVKTTTAWPIGDICIEIVNCQDSQMILLDLAIVARVVQYMELEHQASTRQCFSFSAMIISILQKTFPQIKVSNNTSWLKADHGREMEVSDKKGGAYRRIPSYSEQPEVFTEIYNVFETHNAEIYSSVNHLNTGYIFADYLLP